MLERIKSSRTICRNNLSVYGRSKQMADGGGSGGDECPFDGHGHACVVVRHYSSEYAQTIWQPPSLPQPPRRVHKWRPHAMFYVQHARIVWTGNNCGEWRSAQARTASRRPRAHVTRAFMCVSMCVCTLSHHLFKLLCHEWYLNSAACTFTICGMCVCVCSPAHVRQIDGLHFAFCRPIIALRYGYIYIVNCRAHSGPIIVERSQCAKCVVESQSFILQWHSTTFRDTMDRWIQRCSIPTKSQDLI